MKKFIDFIMKIEHFFESNTIALVIFVFIVITGAFIVYLFVPVASVNFIYSQY